METKIKNVKEILSEKLTMSQRGIMITILLNKEDNPKITLAKCKASFNFNKNKEDLIFLHDNNFIKWGQVEKAKESLEKLKLEPEVVDIINFMNNLYKRRFSPTSGNTRTSLLNRLKKHSVDDIKKVIANRYSVWKDEPMMSKYLQPSTIFSASKFDKYLEEVNHTREGESFVNASNLNLLDKAEITLEIANQLIETDTYNLKRFNTDKSGNKKGSGQELVRYGKDIKKLIHVQNSQEKFNGKKEFLYYYNAKK
mgnify:CR=1 FL=1|tara:strand:+ start:374 stop:1135 length:762 start_codon:yes stop_codon:yes gene_type:complete